MSLDFAPTTPALIGQVAELFKECFPDDPSPMSTRMMGWKYFDLHPFWKRPRSYVVLQEGAVGAHVGLAPIRFAAKDRTVDSIQFLDWMATPRAPGSGLLAYWECLQVVDTVLAVGGSEDARRILPKLGWLRPMAELRTYARPLRVSNESAAATPNRFKAKLKLARNWWWSVAPPLPSAGGWRCRPVPLFEAVWTPRGDFIPIERTADWLNFHLACPGARFEAILLERDGRPAGHALLAHAGPQIRVADFAIDAPEEEQWVRACSALVRAAAFLPTCYEIAAASSLPLLQRVYSRCGFRYRGSDAVYLGDPKRRFPPDALLELSLLTGDSAYLVNPRFPLWC